MSLLVSGKPGSLQHCLQTTGKEKGCKVATFTMNEKLPHLCPWETQKPFDHDYDQKQNTLENFMGNGFGMRRLDEHCKNKAAHSSFITAPNKAHT